MDSGDIIGLILVYAYVILLLVISEKVLKKYPNFSRKFLHIMVGNVLFILPFFQSRWVMALLAAAPFILLTFLISPNSPLKIKDRISGSGHGLGLVYYAISWTVLALLFFNQPWIIAVGIAAMSYGDGMASLIGMKYGKIKYNLTGDNKSLEGSLTMFIVLIGMLWVVLMYYAVPVQPMVIVSVALVATILEGITPKGLDNITACFSAVITYLILTI
ncbi:MAG: diacylglycerol/polyprenol kinase family protein [Methanobacterium formicicum]|jgi:phytol kinase|uniref:diacylglycerol/polyprenol kinase family protein n=1 Tax=Methanobacterium formicicum TaxID=2162 RepID=UPI003530BC10